MGNLAYQTVENDLKEYFAQAGQVSSVRGLIDRYSGRSRGFAFIEMSSIAEALKAVETLHDKNFHGRPLTVNLARPREDHPPQLACAKDRGESLRTENAPPGN